MRAASQVLSRWSGARERELTIDEALSHLRVDHDCGERDKP
jgi:hypothetical protein